MFVVVTGDLVLNTCHRTMMVRWFAHDPWKQRHDCMAPGKSNHVDMQPVSRWCVLY